MQEFYCRGMYQEKLGVTPLPSVSFKALPINNLPPEKTWLDITAGFSMAGMLGWLYTAGKQVRHTRSIGVLEAASIITPFINPICFFLVGTYTIHHLNKMVHSDCKRNQERDVEYFRSEVERFCEQNNTAVQQLSERLQQQEVRLGKQESALGKAADDLGKLHENLSEIGEHIEKLQDATTRAENKLKTEALPKLELILKNIKALSSPSAGVPHDNASPQQKLPAWKRLFQHQGNRPDHS